MFVLSRRQADDEMAFLGCATAYSVMAEVRGSLTGRTKIVEQYYERVSFF